LSRPCNANHRVLAKRSASLPWKDRVHEAGIFISSATTRRGLSTRRQTTCSKRRAQGIAAKRFGRSSTTFQIYGGKAYFTDEPFERILRDARINQIGEGANDVLRNFIALVGMRDVGLELQGVLEAVKNPLGNFGKISHFMARKVSSLVASPDVHATAQLHDNAALGRVVGSSAAVGPSYARIKRCSTNNTCSGDLRRRDELYVCGCVLNRLDALCRDEHADETCKQRQLQIARYYLMTARRRILATLDALWDNDDDATTTIANLALKG
jgi:hypothetical protein